MVCWNVAYISPLIIGIGASPSNPNDRFRSEESYTADGIKDAVYSAIPFLTIKFSI